MRNVNTAMDMEGHSRTRAEAQVVSVRRLQQGRAGGPKGRHHNPPHLRGSHLAVVQGAAPEPHRRVEWPRKYESEHDTPQNVIGNQHELLESRKPSWSGCARNSIILWD